MRLQQCRVFFLTIAVVCSAGWARPESARAAAGIAPNLSSVEVVEAMQQHAEARTQELKHYTALRHYQVEYRGFSTTLGAKMDVEETFDAATGKSFRVVSQSGSNFLCEKVLKRAVEGEQEASRNQDSTALTPANYRFQMAGNESVDGRPAYILQVEPVTPSKFLYKGKIWVDAADFAVVKMESEPAKNPSFWISRTMIYYTTALADGFWMPQGLRSETKVRIGGTAVLTINYGSYQVDSKNTEQGTGISE